MWQRSQLRKARHTAIAAYAEEMARTNLDLDPDLELSGIEHLGRAGNKAEMQRGGVYWTDLVPRSGSERAGRRPMILMSHDGFTQTPTRRLIIATSATQSKQGLTVVEIYDRTASLPKKSFAIK